MDLTEEHRIRCAAHIIQIIVKAVIYGRGLSKFELSLSQAAPQEQFEMFRQQGVVGRLHNFVNAVLASHKRREAFMTIQKDLNDDDPLWAFSTLNLVQNGGVRWHSVYRMLLRCLELKDSINLFIRKRGGSTVDSYLPGSSALSEPISEDEWDEAQHLADFLREFYEMTKRIEGGGAQGSLWMTIVNLQYLYNELNKMKDILKDEGSTHYLKNGVLYGIEKLLTYWEKIVIEPEVSYYAVATILHPRLRLLWFKDHWRRHTIWHKKAEASMEIVFQRYVDAEEIDEEEQLAEPTRRKAPGGLYDRTLTVDTSLLTGVRSYKRARKATELAQYYDAIGPDIEDAEQVGEESLLYGDPLTWWQKVGRETYPTLYKIALDFLSIPATSCECERAFSGGRRTVTFERNLLSGSTIEALQLQKDWLKKGLMRSNLKELVDYINSRKKIPTVTP